MASIINNSTDKVKGVEVLYFEEAEVEKTKNNTFSFASIGSLSVLYFKDYDRFVLQINDWKYPLIRRLSVTRGVDNTYILPGLHGFHFLLRINKSSSSDALKNFETILLNNSKWGGKTTETSPDDKLVRQKPKESSTDKTTETTSTTESVKTKRTKSTKTRSNLKDIKTKDFKKDVSATLNKEFLENAEKRTKEFLQRRSENPYLNKVADFSELRKALESAPVEYVYREDLEEVILNNKEIVLSH